MTEAQKDAIVAAAKEWVREFGRHRWDDESEHARLIAAVRAAEQRWTVEAETVGRNAGMWAVVRDGREFGCYALERSDADRIARLLNEDDARGGGK